jgi:hypothetical protein
VKHLALAGLTALSLAIACSPIVAQPLSGAPLNAGCPEEHGCDLYDVAADGGAEAGATTPAGTTMPKAQCNEGRCDFGRPAFDFWAVVSVPDSSYYAPGRTFVLTSNDLSAQPGAAAPGVTCRPPLCVQLPELVSAEGKYRVTAAASTAVGFPLAEGTSIPVRVAFVPLVEGLENEATTFGLPADALFTSSRVIRKAKERPEEVSYVDAVSVGRYVRIAYPEPPFDAWFPPVLSQLSVSDTFLDDFVLGDPKTPLDDDKGDSRRATVTRAEGLDGWRVWLVDSVTDRRISSIHTLSGTTMDVRLDTFGQSQTSSAALREGVEVIVAPPSSWLGVPQLQSRIINGQGLESLLVPPLPGPASIKGVVAVGEGAALTGIPSRLLFTSTRLRRADGTPDPLLRFSTTVSTDNTGHFATVLPPGFYDVTIEPAEGTGCAEGVGCAKVKDSFDTSEMLGKTFRPPPRTIAAGRVMLADGRPLAEADILAVPSDIPVVGNAVKPRPARTRTAPDGTFRFEVDQGQYDFIVDPQSGTGFPRVVQLRSFATGTADLGVIQVAPPARLSFTLRDPSLPGNPIVRAMVRIFALAPGRGPPTVEIGRAMTDETGKCEILLAQQPR